MKIDANNTSLELNDIQSVSEIKDSGKGIKYFYVTVNDKTILFEANKMRTDLDKSGITHLRTLREFIITLMNSGSIIAELEEYPRGPYGGAVGYISFNGNMDLAITIRTACIENGKLTVNAGAGIVYDSDPEKERLETVNKAKAIQKALQLIEEQK